MEILGMLSIAFKRFRMQKLGLFQQRASYEFHMSSI